MKPSIFNDVIGPVMRGPSSSHTAAAHRIGTLLRQLLPPARGRVTVELDRNGALATTYEGQGSAMGLISGLAGLSILDPSVVQYKSLAEKHGFQIDFVITDFTAPHPNTYKIRWENPAHPTMEMIAVSTGGGMIEILEINGFKVSIRGDGYETLVCLVSRSLPSMEELCLVLEKRLGIRPAMVRKDPQDFLFHMKTRSPIIPEVKKILAGREGISWIKQIDPVVPVLSGSGETLPFTTVREMLNISAGTNSDLATLAFAYEHARSGLRRRKIKSLMQEIVDHIRRSRDEGLKGKTYDDRLLGHQSHLVLVAEKEKKILRTPTNTIIAYVTAIMESKSSMEIIVAAPTAGSCGVLGGAIFGLAAHRRAGREVITHAFLAAGLIGVFIADKYSFAAEEGGCQVECGAASAMAAAGLVQLLGGDARQAVNAASMALQNLLGLICDPVADRVEVPCLGKNILAATNALNSAHMALAGFDPVIPLDEVIDAMKAVGEQMPRTLCCTGLGGLSCTPTAKKLHGKMKGL